MRPTLAAFAVAFLLSGLSAQDTTRIFWFGHSLLASGSNGRASEFAAWSRQTGIPIRQKMLNAGCGYSYEIMQSWNSTCNPDTIRRATWDWVIYNVLYKVYLPEDSFFKYHALYADVIDSVGAKGVLYDDWHQPSTAAAKKACTDNGTCLSPVQTAFLWVSQRYPDIHYKVDWAHAAEPLGYLAGAVTWATVFCMKPFGFDTVYPGMDRETAHLMQQVAWNTVTDTACLPYMPWSPLPALVRSVDFSPSPDTIEQYRTVQLLVRAHFDNDSSDAGTKWAIFRSLDPHVVSVSHSGLATGVNIGTGRVEAVRERAADTLYLTVKATTLTLDSVRIAPRTFASYLESGFQFSATGFFRDGLVRSTQAVTASINWYTSDSTIFTIAGGKLQRTSGRGGEMWVAAELAGKTDTVRFTLPPQLQYLKRINFQPDTTVFNPVWTPDWGRPYSDSLGFGWEDVPMWDGKPYFEGNMDGDAINYRGANFLTHSYISPRSPQGRYDTIGTFHLKCLDGDYIVKVGLGHGDWIAIDTQFSTVTFNGDTLAHDTSWAHKPMTAYKDTIRVFGMDGIRLKMKGAVNYLVVCTKEGVDIDSIALDNGEFAVKAPPSGAEGGNGSRAAKVSLSAWPNPFNPITTFRLHGAFSRGALRIYDSRGRMVRSMRIEGRSACWNAEGLPSGLYVARYSDNRVRLEKKIILMK